MKKIIYTLFSLLLPTLLTAPAFASTQVQISSHPGFMGHHLSSKVGNGSSVSTNWSGYAATGANNSFTSVSSSWVQPALNCAALAKNAYSSYWVGLDGYNDSTVEQIGTEADCVNGQATYGMWYEMYPQNPYEVQLGLALNPGDQMAAAVRYNPAQYSTFHGRSRLVANASYTLTLTNNTTHRSFSTTQTARQNALRSSAEVIAEAPYSRGILPLADFDTVYFTNATANGLPLGGSANLQDIIMENPAGMVATPSTFDPTNQSFSVVWSNPTAV